MGWIALLLFLAISIPLASYGHSERSGWIKMTTPVGRIHAINNLIGYSGICNGTPIHKENIPFIHQVLMFSGSDQYVTGSFYTIRGYYGFFATLLAPFLGLFGALLATNFLAWCACAWASWRFTKRLCKDELAAIIAVVLVAGGMGAITHIGDYSAHLFGFASYALGVLLLYESEVWLTAQPFRKHLFIGICLAIACLMYTSSIALVVAYVLMALPINRWYRVATATIIALTSRPIWVNTLKFLGVAVEDTEGDYLRVALNAWKNLLPQPLALITKVGGYVIEFFCFDSPLVTIAGLIALVIVIKNRSSLKFTWFCLLLFFTPIAASIVYAPSAAAPGYLVYGISIFNYCALGAMLAHRLRGHGLQQKLALSALIIITGSHFIWSTAHYWGHPGPLITYFLGFKEGLPIVFHAQPEIVSLTGHEQTPVLFGGSASLVSAGSYLEAATAPLAKEQIYLFSALKFRLLFCAYFGLLVLVVRISLIRRLVLSSLIGFLFAISSLLSVNTLKSVPRLTNVDGAVSLNSGDRLEYRIQLSDSFRQKLSDNLAAGDRIRFYLPAFASSFDLSGQSVRIFAGAQEITSRLKVVGNSPGPLQWESVDARALVSELSKYKELSLTVSTVSPTIIRGWQKNGLAARQLTVTPASQSQTVYKCLPALEVRMIRADGNIKMAGF